MSRLQRLIAVLLIVISSSISFADSVKPRIISLTPSLTDTIVDLGGADLLVGVSAYDKQRVPNLKQAQALGDLGNYSLEKIISVQPDIILIWPSSIKPSQEQQLTSLGYKIVVSNPQTLDQLAVEIAKLGQLIGKEQQGKELAQKMQQELAQLRQRYYRKQPIKVFYQLWDKPIYTIGKGQIIGDALKICGAQNIFDEIDLPAPQVSVEAVLARDPQAIIASKQPLLDAWHVWPQLTAVKDKQLILFQDERIARPSFAMLQATKKLCRLLNNE